MTTITMAIIFESGISHRKINKMSDFDWPDGCKNANYYCHEINDYLSEFQAKYKAQEQLNHCIQCKQKFSHENVFTEEGKAETQISQLCEKCFDALFQYDE